MCVSRPVEHQLQLHSAGGPGHGTSHVLYNGGLFTFMEANKALTIIGI